MNAINLQDKYARFTEHWTPKIIAESNGHHVKITKVKGDFIWHDHKDEDELFMVIKGRLVIQFRDGSVELNPGELYVVPRGVEHKPSAEEETQILVIGPKQTKHTGDVEADITIDLADLEWI